MNKYSFSGHESFQCKSLWLKKGYDFLEKDHRFTADDATVKLGVGKNMVSSIRFWLRACGLSQSDELTDIANYLFNEKYGRDPYSEDLNTLWLLHFLLINQEIASIYYLVFVDYQRERKEFSRNDLQAFIRRKCSSLEQRNVYNENTVKKDIGVLLKNYVAPTDLKNIEDFSPIFVSLNFIVAKNYEMYNFREVTPAEIAPEIILFALLSVSGNEKTISLDGLQKLSLIFGLSLVSLVEIIRKLEQKYKHELIFSENSGIKNVQFVRRMNKYEILDRYYKNNA